MGGGCDWIGFSEGGLERSFESAPSERVFGKIFFIEGGAGLVPTLRGTLEPRHGVMILSWSLRYSCRLLNTRLHYERKERSLDGSDPSGSRVLTRDLGAGGNDLVEAVYRSGSLRVVLGMSTSLPQRKLS